MGKLIEANKEEFQEIINSEEGVVLVDFWAPWCGPCKMLGPILDEISNEIKDVIIVKVNVDENSEMSVEYGVRGIPCVHAIKGGESVDKFVGLKQKEDIISFIEKNQSNES